MEYFLMIIAVPVAFAIGMKFFFHKDITVKELLITLAISTVIGGLVVAAGYHRSVGDVEIISGYVTGKERVKVSCEHSYSCNCYTSCSGSGNTRSCSTHCQTCYEHWHDFDWNVKSTIGTFTIDRIDRQGEDMPPRWESVKAYEPVAREAFYENWIKAAPDSLFHALDVKGHEKFIPNYPETFDYYRINRLVANGVKFPDAKLWNQELEYMLRALGAKKQVNVVIVATNRSESFADALNAKWLGGKKNDVLIVVGSKKYPEMDWVRVISWTDSQIFKVALRDDLQKIGKLDRTEWMKAISSNINTYYVRKPMADFDYLKDAVEPPTWSLLLAFILAMASSIGLTIFMKKNDIA